MRRKQIGCLLLGLATVGCLVLAMAAPAQAWRSPINVDEYYAPPGPPGWNPVGTACRVDTMNGEYAGTAFAKIRLDNSTCVDATVQVVYQQGSGVAGGIGNGGVCCGYWIQDQAAGRNIVGANFALEARDYRTVIVWSTGVFG
jgi:hypothetical protein